MPDSPSHSLVLQRITAQIFPDSTLSKVTAFGVDESDDEAITKAIGYGKPLLLEVEDAQGKLQRVVFHTAGANGFGHDRRADRAAAMLLAFDTFTRIPGHSRALDVGSVTADGRVLSLRQSGEFYLVTTFAEGHVYAEELAQAARSACVGERERRHVRKLADYLAALHRAPLEAPLAYVRATRDLLGSGEGIFGIIDGYPSETPRALLERLKRIEERCLGWRWKLKQRPDRARTIHGDFHPFNLLFADDDTLTLLDASRGCIGDAADDVACLSVNYVFFALAHPGAWQAGFADLWTSFWQSYLEQSGDRALLECVAPYLVWRVLVLASPAWYSGLNDAARERLLEFAELALEREVFDPELAERAFA